MIRLEAEESHAHCNGHVRRAQFLHSLHGRLSLQMHATAAARARLRATEDQLTIDTTRAAWGMHRRAQDQQPRRREQVALSSVVRAGQSSTSVSPLAVGVSCNQLSPSGRVSLRRLPPRGARQWHDSDVEIARPDDGGHAAARRCLLAVTVFALWVVVVAIAALVTKAA